MPILLLPVLDVHAPRVMSRNRWNSPRRLERNVGRFQRQFTLSNQCIPGKPAPADTPEHGIPRLELRYIVADCFNPPRDVGSESRIFRLPNAARQANKEGCASHV